MVNSMGWTHTHTHAHTYTRLFYVSEEPREARDAIPSRFSSKPCDMCRNNNGLIYSNRTVTDIKEYCKSCNLQTPYILHTYVCTKVLFIVV